ncbi:MAG: M23 family metallopeptidase [Chitinophagales bacterium]
MELSDKQIDWIARDLQQRGLTYHPLKGELLDHICCAIESKHTNGETFEVTYQEVIAAFGVEGIKHIQTETLHLLTHKKYIMRRLTALTATTFMAIVVFLTFNMYAQNAPSMHPLGKEVKVTSHFGMRMHPFLKKEAFHKGIDFKAALGTPIYATADGEVKAVIEDKEGHGNHLILQHDSEYKTVYANLSGFAVEAGVMVKKGQLIAYSGNSGASTAPHLHYEVLKNEEPVDPLDFF